MDIPNIINISDDVLIFGKSEQEHNNALIKVHERLQSRNLTINKKRKIKFSTNRVNFFGYTFTESGVYPDSAEVKAIIDLEQPRSPI